MTVTTDGKRAVSASGDKAIKVWDVEADLLVATFTCDSPLECCAFANARIIVAGDAVGRLHVLVLEEPLSDWRLAVSR